MNFRVFETLEELTDATAQAIVAAARSRERVSIALSGGSTPKPLYAMLGTGALREELARHAITWVVVDERYVPHDDPQSNAAMIERTLFAEGIPAGHRYLPFRTEAGDPQVTVRQFEEEWRELAVDTLDLVLLGCGEDGHTASLFPGTGATEVTEGIATAVWVPRLDQWRVTLTLPVIRAATTRIVQAAGEGKAAMIQQLREGARLPVALATEGLDSWWLVDRAAYGRVSSSR